MSEEWKSRGACNGMPADVFFPEKGEPTNRAKAVCARCEVRSECLTYALDHEIKFGMWGGKSEKQRRMMRPGRQLPGWCRICGADFTFIRVASGNTTPTFCGDRCRRIAKRRQWNGGPPRPGFARDVPHSPCDETDPRDRSAYSSIYPDWTGS